MCAMRMVGEASVTPSIAYEASQFHINVDQAAPFADEAGGGEEGKEKSKQDDQVNARRLRRERIAQYEANVSRSCCCCCCCG